MKAKYLVTPSLKDGTAVGRRGDAPRTDLLMLTNMVGLSLSPSAQAVDDLLEGGLSARIVKKGFKGTLGQNLTVSLPEGYPIRNVLLVGLGDLRRFDIHALDKVVGVGVARAVAQGFTRLSMEIPKHRLSAERMNLKGTAHRIKETVEAKLAELGQDDDGILEVELVCTPQARSYLNEGLSAPCKTARACCKRLRKSGKSPDAKTVESQTDKSCCGTEREQ